MSDFDESKDNLDLTSNIEGGAEKSPELIEFDFLIDSLEEIDGLIEINYEDYNEEFENLEGSDIDVVRVIKDLKGANSELLAELVIIGDALKEGNQGNVTRAIALYKQFKTNEYKIKNLYDSRAGTLEEETAFLYTEDKKLYDEIIKIDNDIKVAEARWLKPLGTVKTLRQQREELVTRRDEISKDQLAKNNEL
ncbi:MAG: hypothetical protein Q9M91_04115 [Candidatus Dojkabacteria bacterium]|nr:hypothetical protein [Candidatus Dojkabacteria bacterium]MDQ7020999.1 hypothetical protein [Candidatus Dojkabacteria bacterium]